MYGVSLPDVPLVMAIGQRLEIQTYMDIGCLTKNLNNTRHPESVVNFSPFSTMRKKSAKR